ncbi:serpin B4 [Dasypus novemcinctus]|uniref:serpin B4 n=1 Tax=Dasypus novemcinctus TaxID=9361 RepID=UPI000329005C|nr:serpin B4 [Dasypus novemcinctus]
MNSLSDASTHFGLDLFQELRTLKKGNISFSPVNIFSGLSMLLLGAKGNTALEIEKVLHLKRVTENANVRTTKEQVSHTVDSPGNVHQQFRKLLTELKKSTGAYELNIANSLYIEKTYKFLQDYLDNIKEFYLANAESVDFLHASEESREKINSWVESQTHGKIKHLFPRDSLSNSTRMVLANALYFKGKWDKEFKKEHTEEAEFWINKDTSKPVQMMKQRGTFNFAFLEDVQAKVVEIPYKGKDLSMFVLLPNEVDGLQKLEDKLTAEKLKEWVSSPVMRERHVHLQLPRFRLEESYDLPPPLQHLGMVHAFQDADFSGMTGGRDLRISKILHKSSVEVTEEGTEAEAATGVEAVALSSPVYEELRVDHSFLFFIRKRLTDSILFLGRVCSP